MKVNIICACSLCLIFPQCNYAWNEKKISTPENTNKAKKISLKQKPFDSHMVNKPTPKNLIFCEMSETEKKKRSEKALAEVIRLHPGPVYEIGAISSSSIHIWRTPKTPGGYLVVNFNKAGDVSSITRGK